MVEKITVNGKELDLYENEKINLNLQLNNINDISTRNSYYSNTISVPRTAKNTKALDYLGVVGNTSRIPYKRVKCTYTQNTIPLIREGYIQVTDTTEDSFKIVLFDGVIDLSERLKNKTLSDLNLIEYNHYINIPDYLDSFTNTEGYIYALADYGAYSPDDIYRIEYQAPALFAHTVFDKILTDAGFSYSGAIFNSPDYKDLLLSPTNGYVVEDESAVLTELATIESEPIAVYIEEQQETTYHYDLEWEYDTTPVSGFTITDPNTITVNFDGSIKIDIQNIVGITAGTVRVEIWKNNTYIKQITFDQTGSNTDENEIFIQVLDGDTIYGFIDATSELAFDTTYVLEFTNSNSLTFSQQTGGQIVDLNNLYQDVAQDKIIKDIMQHFGMILTKTSENQLTFITMEELLQSHNTAEDWTSKIIDQTNEEYDLKGYGINNFMKYKYDEAYRENFYFDGTMEVDNEHFQFEKTLFTSIFEMKPRPYKRFNVPVALIPIWEENDNGGSITVTPRETQIGLFRLRKYNQSTQFKLYENGQNYVHSGDIPYMSYVNIGYQYFINNYYSEFNKLLDTSKILTFNANLSRMDLYNLDFFRLKYLKQTGKYYYLNSVKVTANKTKVEMVEINQPFNNI